MDLFGNEKIRTIGLYQPYATLMLHGKIESRYVKLGKKPPFPLGTYLIYSTKKSYDYRQFSDIAGKHTQRGYDLFREDNTSIMAGFALAIGKLVKVRPFRVDDQERAFVDVQEHFDDCDDDNLILNVVREDGLVDWLQLWALVFEDVKRINPFPFKGKQGVGFFPEDQKYLIKIL